MFCRCAFRRFLLNRVNACTPMESQQKERIQNILKGPNDQCMARWGRQLMESGVWGGGSWCGSNNLSMYCTLLLMRSLHNLAIPLKRTANTTCAVFLSDSLCCWKNTITTSVKRGRISPVCGVPDRFTAWGMFIIIISQHHFPPWLCPVSLLYVQYKAKMYI
jgi:hypothetical protein